MYGYSQCILGLLDNGKRGASYGMTGSTGGNLVELSTPALTARNRQNEDVRAFPVMFLLFCSADPSFIVTAKL
jgi:hypothetical protein